MKFCMKSCAGEKYYHAIQDGNFDTENWTLHYARSQSEQSANNLSTPNYGEWENHCTTQTSAIHVVDHA